MCHRPNCNCTIANPLDEFYSVCFDCGASIDVTPLPFMDITDRPEKRTTRNEQRDIILAAIVSHWKEIKELRRATVGILTIKNTLDLPGHITSIQKHISALLAKEGDSIPVAHGRKKQYVNYGVVKRQHKQEGFYFGSHA